MLYVGVVPDCNDMDTVHVKAPSSPRSKLYSVTSISASNLGLPLVLPPMAIVTVLVPVLTLKTSWDLLLAELK